PANPEYSSLNLATAVQVICYEIRMAHLLATEGKTLTQHTWDMPPASAESLDAYYKHLEETLVALDFLDPANPKQTMTRLRRLYTKPRPWRVAQRARPGQRELLSPHDALTAKR